MNPTNTNKPENQDDCSSMMMFAKAAVDNISQQPPSDNEEDAKNVDFFCQQPSMEGEINQGEYVMDTTFQGRSAFTQDCIGSLVSLYNNDEGGLHGKFF